MSPPIDDIPLAGENKLLSRRGLLIGAGIAASALGVGLNPVSASASASATTSGGILRMGAPWGGYSNGQIPLSQLTAVSGHYFRSDAAQSMVAMRAAYQAALGKTLVINDGYRDLAGQQQAWYEYQYQGGNLAAYPGTSNHGWATAVDFGGEVYTGSWTQGHRWLQANAAAYGWWWAGKNFGQIEYWHWEFDGAYTGTPTTDQSAIYRRNNNMASLYYKTEGGLAFALAGDGVGSAGWLEFTDQSLANALAMQHGNAALLGLASWNGWKAKYLGGP